MAIRRRAPSTDWPPELTPNVVAVLLGGWSAPSPEDDPDPFAVFDAPLEALWRTHRTRLLEEWARRGGVGRPWAQRQFEPREEDDHGDV